MRIKADLALLIVAMLWGSAFAAQRVAGVLGSVYFFNGARFLLAAMLLLPFAFGGKVPQRQWAWMGAAGLILFLASAFQQAGLQTTTAGNAGFITSLYVVLVPILLRVLWKDRAGAPAIVAVLLAAIGAFLLSTTGNNAIREGDVLELVGAAFWALHVIVLGKFARRFRSISFSAGQLFTGGILNCLASVALERPSLALPPPLVAAIAYTAVASLALGFTLQIWGQRHTPPTHAAIILSLESVFAVLAGWLFLQEHLTCSQISGAVLIFGSVLISQAGRWGKIGRVAQADDQI